MSEQLLDDTQVRSVLQQMGGEGVTQGMGTNSLLDTCRFAQPTHDGEDHGTRERTTVAVHEGVVLILRLVRPCSAFLEPVTEPLFGNRRKRHEPLFGTLTIDEHIMLMEVDLAQLEVHQFAHAQTATVEHLHHGAIAVAFVGSEVDGCHHPIDLIEGEDGRQVFGFLGSFKQFRGVLVDIVLIEQKAEPRMDAGEHAGLGAF